MDDNIRMGGFQILPPVIKNLLIINALFFLAKLVVQNFGIDLDTWLGLHYFSAPDFHIWQLVTYMFMHANFGHLFFNMFALWMFGAVVENYWGTKRFLFYYFATGIGAGLVHYAVLGYTLQPDLNLIDAFVANPDFTNFANFYQQNHISGLTPEFRRHLSECYSYLSANPNDAQALNAVGDQLARLKDDLTNIHVIVGASGACFGVMLAFGMLFPNSQIYLYFLIPIKAKWFVLGYGLLELIFGVTGTADGIGHFAHLGGMLVGIILILLWRRNDQQRSQDVDEWY
ncbi:MAG: rhomboid family intramembrane serine protease [Bacteroidales bacterium]|nr:rhomboid family intramembrane serine protease [Bacteroidales bacterium]